MRKSARSPSGSGRFRTQRFDVNRPTERLLVLALLAILAGVGVGVALPQLSTPVAEVTGEYLASGPAVETLNQLAVDDAQNASGYDRDSFGYRQTDEDGNGCDIRDDVLARDLQNTVTTGCQVESGVLEDPYTGSTIEFTRGKSTSSAVQIDHVVALENAWQSGAKSWSTAEKYQFGNDPYNMLAVDGPTNEAKGSASAAYWLPTNGEYRCEYVARQIGVKAAYKLSVASDEKQAMLAVLNSCPNQQIPQR